jgi:hypothetical protein
LRIAELLQLSGDREKARAGGAHVHA